MAARNGGLERAQFLVCMVQNGGLSKFEMQTMPEPERNALQATLRAQCGNLAESDWVEGAAAPPTLPFNPLLETEENSRRAFHSDTTTLPSKPVVPSKPVDTTGLAAETKAVAEKARAAKAELEAAASEKQAKEKAATAKAKEDAELSDKAEKKANEATATVKAARDAAAKLVADHQARYTALASLEKANAKAAKEALVAKLAAEKAAKEKTAATAKATARRHRAIPRPFPDGSDRDSSSCCSCYPSPSYQASSRRSEWPML